MKAGVIGIVNGEFEELDSYHETVTQDGKKFTRSIQIRQSGYTDSGQEVLVGQAATQTVEQEESIQIDEETGEIVVTERPVKESKYTDFIAVSNEFVAVSSGSGEFAFNLIQNQVPSVEIERAEFNLNAYAEDYYTAEEVDPWQVGFYGNLGNAEKGVVYGEEVFGDDEIGDILERSQLNQLGLQYQYSSTPIKMTITESGYVEVYQPTNFDELDFTEYIIEEILDYESNTEKQQIPA